MEHNRKEQRRALLDAQAALEPIRRSTGGEAMRNYLLLRRQDLLTDLEYARDTSVLVIQGQLAEIRHLLGVLELEAPNYHIKY